MSLILRDQFLAPGLYSSIAEDLSRRIARGCSGPMLEILADTGTLTQAAAAAVAADVTILATDPLSNSVERCSQKPGMSRVNWQRADPEALGFQDNAFGTVFCLLGMATVPNRVEVLKEVRRVLRADGRFLFAVPAHIRHMPIAACVQDALAIRFGANPPRFLTERLFGYADTEVIDDDLTQAGFTDAVYTAVDLPFAAKSAQEVAIGFCMGTDLRADIEERAAGDLPHATEMVATSLRKKFGAGEISSTMRVNIVSASG